MTAFGQQAFGAAPKQRVALLPVFDGDVTVWIRYTMPQHVKPRRKELPTLPDQLQGSKFNTDVEEVASRCWLGG